jgi:hypothetical protein
MASSPTVTLFTEQLDSGRSPITFVLSAVVHVGVIALVAFGVLYSPKVIIRPADPSLVRHISLLAPLPKPPRPLKGIVYRGSAANAPKPAPHPPMLQRTAKAKLGPQTLIQPDLERNLAINQQIPVPQALIWTAPTKVVKNIVAPPPSTPITAQSKPSFEAPNHEINVSDVNIASSLASQQLINIQPSSTSPVVTHAEISLDQPPSTVTQVSAQPTPAAIFSLSNLRMEGTATLPSVNESAKAENDGTLSPSDSGGGQGTGSGAGKSAGKGAGLSGLVVGAGREGQPNGTRTGDDATNVTLPHDGVFGAVVVGDTLQDEYPELAGVWNGRLAYTVYLHVGLARSWILQFSLPDDATIAIGAKAEHLEAPWPYSIVRPNLAAGAIAADALLVHGYVDQSGRFENLSIAFPQNFPQAQFVIDSLKHWQFRPATENGQSARVEILLIIPEELE